MNTPPQKKAYKSALQKELLYQQLSLPIVTELLITAKNTTGEISSQLDALASRIHFCNYNSNAYFVEKAYTNQDGSTTNATGRFWRCHSKLCPSCLAIHSKATRRKLREALSRQKPLKNERYYFATLTIPNLGLPLLKSRSIIDRAWSLLRKRSLCVSLIRGGCKSEEFTVTPVGIHYHHHHIWLCKWFDYDNMRAEWTSCVEQSFIDHNMHTEWRSQQKRRLEQWKKFHANNPEKLARPDLKLQCKFYPVNSIDKAIQEIAKYVTKCDSWIKIPRADLIDIALIPKWNRMFEVYGTFSHRGATQDELPKTIVHTRPLTDGGSPPSNHYWRDKLANLGLEYYLYTLEEQIDRAREFGLRELRSKFPGKVITTFDCM